MRNKIILSSQELGNFLQVNSKIEGRFLLKQLEISVKPITAYRVQSCDMVVAVGSTGKK